MSHVSASCAIITLFFLLLLSSDHYRPAAALYRWTHWHISVCTNGGRHHCSCAGSQVRLLFINFVCFTLYLSFTPHLSSTLCMIFYPRLVSGRSGRLAVWRKAETASEIFSILVPSTTALLNCQNRLVRRC